jgi:regulator of G-protein signaling
LLNDEEGLHVFTEFLKKEFSQENIQFWTECEKLKASTDPDEVTYLRIVLTSLTKIFFFF